MSIFSAFEISASGMAAQRARLELITANIANAATTKTAAGTPYRRKDAILMSEDVGDFRQYLQGVIVGGIVEDQSPFLKKYEPSHPNADKDGYVLYPNVDPVEEIANLISAARSFEANVTSMTALKDMMTKALDIGR